MNGVRVLFSPDRSSGSLQPNEETAHERERKKLVSFPDSLHQLSASSSA